MNLLSYLPASINLSGSAKEFVVLAAILLVSFLIAWFMGKGQTIALILSFYPAIFFYIQFPFAEKLLIFKNADWQIFLNQLVIFLLFFVPTFLIINIITGRTLAYTDRSRKFALFVLGIGLSIVALVSLHQIVVFERVKSYFPLTGHIWASGDLFFWLLLIPIVLILLFIRR